MNQNVVSHSKYKHNFTEAHFFSYPLKITNALEILSKLTKNKNTKSILR